MRWLCTYGPRALSMPASSNRFSSPDVSVGNGGRQWFRVFTALRRGRIRVSGSKLHLWPRVGARQGWNPIDGRAAASRSAC